MRPRFCASGLLFLLSLTLAALTTGILRAQEPESDEKDPTKFESAAQDVLPGEDLPQVYYVPDADGKLQPLLGMSYERVMQLWKQERQVVRANERPAYGIEKLEISGTATGDRAELVARFEIAVHRDDWVGVPLRLGGAVLRETPSYDGPGKYEMHVDPDGDGHVLWIRGDEEQPHRVTLKLAARVEQVGPQSRLQLTVPRSAVSQLQLQVPLENAQAEVSEGSTLDSVRPLAGGKTELKVIGMGGEFEMTWHAADSNVASVPSILEASGVQTIRVNGRSVSTKATLSVRSLGSPFDHFRIRLPPGADYVGATQSDVKLVAVDVAAAEGKLYEARLDEKTVGPVEVQLVTERAHDAAQADEMLQLAGFEVVGAVRQWGTIAVQVEGNWQIVWGETNHVRRVDDVGADIRRDELAAGFEYFVQPYSLMARVVAQETRTRVEPEYVLLVGADEARLQARLNYTIHGADVNSLRVEIPGWELDSVGPPNLVSGDAAITGNGDSKTVALLRLLQATTGPIELTLEAHRSIEPGAQSVTLEMPRPLGEVASADVAVVSDDDIELIPHPDRMTSLAAHSVRPAINLPERQHEPLFFRTTGENATFVADIQLHEQSISAALATKLSVGEGDTQVEQRLTYHVAYQPTDRFTVIVPQGIRPEGMSIFYKGERITASPGPPAERDDEATPVTIDLPEPVIGRQELEIRYALLHEKPTAQTSTLVEVPLVVPGEGKLTDNQLAVDSGAGIEVKYPKGPWSRDRQPERPPQSDHLALTATAPIPGVTLAVSSKQTPAAEATTVERGWIETYLSHANRQDRAVFQLGSRARQLELTLPAGVDPRTFVVKVDGTRVVPDSIKQREVVIDLPGGGTGEHLLELWYSFSERPPRGALQLAAPRLKSASWVQLLYWQLTVPEDEHVLYTRVPYTEELDWAWTGWLWQRQPTLSRAELESWMSGGNPALVAQLEARPAWDSGTTNHYLFSTVGDAEPLALRTTSRAWLVLYGSLPLLAAGLLLIYFPAVRHPASLFVLAVLVCGASIVAPQPALLLAQASVLGLVLLGLAALLARLMPTARPAPMPSHGSSRAVIERSVTELYQRAPSGGSHPPSTATDPLVSISPEAE
ncbi:MAG: hypothetical protein DWQ37_13800 [Planctomycetota bacterium]|nr:MAG: hypothetical protein DWQ37_13800 [Planctomycetota bacterium]